MHFSMIFPYIEKNKKQNKNVKQPLGGNVGHPKCVSLNHHMSDFQTAEEV